MIKFDKLLGKVRERDDNGISTYLEDSTGAVIGLFKNGILMEETNKYLITQSGERLNTQAGEDLIYDQDGQEL